MIVPRLYEAWATDFSQNGIGPLSDAIECRVTQSQGASLLEMKYPVSGRLFEELQSMRIICAQPEPDANYRFAPVNVPGKHPISRALPVDMSDSSWAVENHPDLVEKARKYILDNNVGQPEVSLTVKISSLRNSKDYGDVEQLEKISFGDTVHVYFPNLEITSSARVSKTVYDCLRARYDSIDIGSEKKNAADVIENQQRQINRLKN